MLLSGNWIKSDLFIYEQKLRISSILDTNCKSFSMRVTPSIFSLTSKYLGYTKWYYWVCTYLMWIEKVFYCVVWSYGNVKFVRQYSNTVLIQQVTVWLKRKYIWKVLIRWNYLESTTAGSMQSSQIFRNSRLFPEVANWLSKE